MHLFGFTLGEKLAEHRTGTLLCAVRQADDYPVLLKIAPPSLPGSAAKHAFSVEIGILERLDPDNVSVPIGIVFDHQSTALCLEPCVELPIAPMLGAPMDAALFFQLAMPIAAALGNVHRREVLHRNLSPQNIFVDPARRSARIFDFSLSCAMREARPFDKPRAALTYTAPEETGRMVRPVDHRADLYSLGALFYEMLAGKPPFVESDPMALIHAIMAQEPVHLCALRPDLPAALGKIIEKLLSKNAEDRYRSALGLLNDLKRAEGFLSHPEAAAGFEAGAWERGPVLQWPHALYGRAREQEMLINAFEQAASGEKILAFIEGHTGAGKTSLVHILNEPVAARSGYLVSAQFEPLHRVLPSTVLISLMDALCVAVIAGKDERALDLWLDRVQRGLGSGLSALASMLPSLREKIRERIEESGQKTPTPSAPDFQKRAERALLHILSVTAQPEHPVVLFLDDLQWTDAPTMRFVQAFAADSAIGHCLVVCAVRGHNFDASHPYLLSKSNIEKLGAHIRTITLEALPQPSVEAILADILGGTAEEIRPLATEVYARTQGNPYFIQTFLRYLHERGFIMFNDATEQWGFALDRIHSAELPEDAAEFLASELLRLSPKVQDILAAAACIGTQFDIHVLSIACELPVSEIRARLEEAAARNLITHVADAKSTSAWAPEDKSGEPSWYEFLHERVRQTAYGLLLSEQILGMRLQIGRRLRDAARARGELNQLVLDFVDHLNTGAAPLEDENELCELSQLNLIAGEKARENEAYEVANRYFAMGSLLAPAHAGDALRFELHINEAECEYLRGDVRQAELLLDRMPVAPPNDTAIVRLCALKMTVKTVLGRSLDAIAAGLEGLASLGFALPSDDGLSGHLAAVEIGKVRAWLSTHTTAELLERPEVSDPKLKAVMRILADLCTPANLVRPGLYGYASSLLASLSLEHGIASESIDAYMLFGMHLATSLNHYEDAGAFGRLALALDARHGPQGNSAKLQAIFGCYAHFIEPLSAVLECFRAAREQGQESADPITVSYACTHILLLRLALGDPLESVEEEWLSFSKEIHQMKVASSIAVHTLIRRVILSQKGLLQNSASLSGDDFEEEAFVASLLKSGLQFPYLYYQSVRQKLAFFSDRHEECVRIAETLTGAGTVWFYFLTEVCLYGCLSLIRLMEATPEGDLEYLLQLDDWHGKLRAWSAACPSNYRSHELLVAAERARLEGHSEAAISLYDHAYEAATNEGHLPVEGLVAEHAARFHWNTGRNSMAAAMMQHAYAAYSQWGAAAHIARLRRRYAWLLRPRSPRRSPANGPALSIPPPPAAAGMPASGALSMPLDLLSVIKASQALFVEVELTRLLDTVMRIVLENAGAEWGVLLLMKSGSLFAAAQMPVRQNSQDPNMFVPMSLVQFVHLSGEPVVLADAMRDNSLLDDAYLKQYRPRSVFCLPLRLQGENIGVLCLENSLVAGAFTVDRTEVLRLLATQIAISLKNAMVYEELVVARRAAETASRAKSAFLASMSHELRTPLNAILGYSELLIEYAQEENAAHMVADLKRIEMAGQHLLELINNILDLSKIEANKMHVSVEQVALLPLLENLSVTLAPVFGQNDNRLIVDAAEDLGTIESDPLRIKQILMNVLGNATKFTHAGMIRLRARRDELWGVQGPGQMPRVVFEISDTGIGMSEEQAAHIFDAFHQVDNSTSRRYGGTGLGLTITRSLCRLLGGDITVKSELGVGTTFTVVLPESISPPSARSAAERLTRPR